MKLRYLIKIICYIFLSVLLTTCDSSVEWKDTPYKVHWIDHSNNRTLALRINDSTETIGRVEAKIVAVGSNKKYVVAKRKILNYDNLFYYYYIIKADDDTYKNADEITQGPFSEKYFLQLKTELKLPEFTTEFKN